MIFNNVETLAKKIAAKLDNEELSQLVEVLDEYPESFGDVISDIAMIRTPELFHSLDQRKKHQ